MRGNDLVAWHGDFHPLKFLVSDDGRLAAPPARNEWTVATDSGVVRRAGSNDGMNHVRIRSTIRARTSSILRPRSCLAVDSFSVSSMRLPVRARRSSAHSTHATGKSAANSHCVVAVRNTSNPRIRH